MRIKPYPDQRNIVTEHTVWFALYYRYTNVQHCALKIKILYLIIFVSIPRKVCLYNFNKFSPTREKHYFLNTCTQYTV